MQPIQLVAANNPNIVRWMCAKCETTGLDWESAQLCCRSLFCLECKQRMIATIKDVLCKECKKGDRATLTRTLFSKAIKIYYHEYEVPFLYWEPETKPGRFFKSKTEVENWCVELNIPTPTWVWGCKPTPVKFNVNSLISEDQQHFVSEEAVKTLQTYLDSWIADQELNTYTCDYGTAVVIDSTLMSECRSAVRREEDAA